MDEEIIAIKHVLLDFPWYDYGLDAVNNAKSDEWAEDLAERIASAR